MLYYLLLWTLLGFIIHFYIIFGTNLLTGGPAQNCCFLPISVFRINRISNGVQRNKIFGNVIFSPNVIQETWTLLQGIKEVVTRVEGDPPRARPLPRGPLEAPPTYSFLLYIPTYPQTIRDGAKNLIPLPQLSISTRSHLGACSGAPPKEGRHHGGLLHHPSPFDEV